MGCCWVQQVHIDDQTSTYRVVNRNKGSVPSLHNPTHHGYTRADDGAVMVTPADQATLEQLLLQRVVAKRQRNFALADQLREQLKAGNVHVDDTTKTYRVSLRRPAAAAHMAGGMTGIMGDGLGIGGAMRAPRQPAPLPTHHGYTRQDDGAVAVDDPILLDQLLLQRVHAKRLRDFSLADQLREQLKAGGVLIDDGSLTYRVVAPRAAGAGGELYYTPKTQHPATATATTSEQSIIIKFRNVEGDVFDCIGFYLLPA